MLGKVKDFLPLNWSIMANPTNWAIVVLMVALAGLSLALIFGANPKNGATTDG